MSDTSLTQGKTFTPDEANATLPLVRAITADVVHLSRDLIERRHRLDLLKGDAASGSADPYAEEIAQIRDEYEKDTQRLQEFIQELSDLGVALQSAPDGLVDFPSELDGRMVYLCWKFNEPEVAHWHEVDSGYAGRQPLAVGSVSGSVNDGGEDLYGASS
jgi:hypothetical protein